MDRWPLDFDIPPIGVGAGWRGLFVLCAGLAILWVSLRHYPRVPGAASRWLARCLLVLRTLAILSVLTLLARPVMTRCSVRTERPTLAVLIDQSKSMSVKDVAAGRTSPISRAAALQKAFEREAAARRSLADSFDVAIAGFATAVSPLGDWTALAAGDATSIAIALDSLMVRSGGPPSVALLFTDGAENASPRERVIEAAARLAQNGTALTTVGVGSEEPAGDVRRLIVRGISVPAEATIGTELAVEAELVAIGFGGAPIRVELRWDDDAADTQTITPDGPRYTKLTRLHYTPRTAGFHRVEVRAIAPNTPRSGASRPAASEALPGWPVQFVHVLDDKLNVLLIESHPRHEAAFIARALAGDARVRLTTILLAPPGEGAWVNPLPKSADEWQRFHLVILGDIERKELSRAHAADLAEAVQTAGTGLIVLGGERNMELLHQPPLSDLSPVEFGAGGAALQNVRVILTPMGRRQLVGQIDSPAASAATAAAAPNARNQLGPLPTATRLGAPRSTTEILAASAAGEPLLATLLAGRGRIVAVGLGETWRWCMSSDDGPRIHTLFWRQLALFAANRRPSAFVRTDRPVYEWAAIGAGRIPVRVEAGVADPLNGKPPAEMSLDLRLRRGDGPAPRKSAEVPVPLHREGDRWIGEVRPDGIGEYELALRASMPTAASNTAASANGSPAVISANSRFVVQGTNVELQSPQTDFDLLRKIADASREAGGRFYPLDKLGECLHCLAATDRRRRVEEVRRTDLSAQFLWPLVLIACGSLCLEWAVRKRAGAI